MANYCKYWMKLSKPRIKTLQLTRFAVTVTVMIHILIGLASYTSAENNAASMQEEWGNFSPSKLQEQKEQAATEPSPKEIKTRNTATSDTSDIIRLSHDYQTAAQKTGFYMAILLIIGALAAHFLVLWFLNKREKCSSKEMVNATGLIYIVFGTIFMARFAVNGDQLSPAMGILGAVAGYLFGSMHRKDE